MKNDRRVLVIGAGVIGLTSALRLREKNFEVEIWARELTATTTSAVAAAFWYPYKVAAGNKTHAWSAETYEEYRLQSQRDIPGVTFVRLLELFRNEIIRPPWLDIVDGYSESDPASLPPGFQAGHTFIVPLADTNVYLPWLRECVEHAGVRIHHTEVKSIASLPRDFTVVVNCSGLGARDLCDDASVVPVRGQVQVVDPLPSTSKDIILCVEADRATYIVPRTANCLLGGTAEENDWNLESKEDIAIDIRRRCQAIVPELEKVDTIENLVGLRPARSEIRLESELDPYGHLVIHNYGHGGAGFTTCWGCANAVVTLAMAES